jgi:hypothetical protein
MKKTAIAIGSAVLVGRSAAVQAAVPTEASIKAVIAAENPNTDLYGFRIVYTGPIGPLRDGAAVAAFTTVITVGNFRARLSVSLSRGVARPSNCPSGRNRLAKLTKCP